MFKNNNHLHLRLLIPAIISCGPAVAFAQNETAEEPEAKVEELTVDEIVTEEVVVTGFRAAIQRSIDDKKLGQNIKDTINAEDMGKTTDQNIADSLGRVTGVSIVSRDGEGAQITVRGAGANQNQITLNGQQLTSTDFSQAVDLSSFSADILSKLEVVKTPSADHDEGSLGATVNLVTVRPLDQASDIRSMTLQGRYSDFSEETNYKLQGALSQKFLDDALGVAFTAYSETNSYRRDEYRAENFVATENTVRNARDQYGNPISNIRGIYNQTTNYELSKNSSDRYGASLGLQWFATDTSEFMVDVTYSKQDLERDTDAVRTRWTGRPNFVEGQSPGIDLRDVAGLTDPQEDWYTFNTDNRTFTKFTGRFNVGDLVNAIGGEEKENLSTTIKFAQDFSDTLKMDVLFGYSSSTSDSKPNAYAVAQNFKQAPATILFDAGDKIEPVGYDCTSGKCEMIFGESFVDLGDQIEDVTEGDVFKAGWEDNIAYTGFNPRDIASQNLAFLSEADVSVEDTLANVQVDFDLDIDDFGITTLEFGVKASQREKKVDNQTYIFDTVTKTKVVIGSGGGAVAEPGGPINNTRAIHFAKDRLEYDNFMESLGYGRNGATSNWQPINALTAKSLVLDDSNTTRTINKLETRENDMDTGALYLKANFAFLDERLTGDIGVRYVRTDTESRGYSGVNFFNANSLEQEFALDKLRELRDTSLAPCKAYDFKNPDPAGNFGLGYENKFQRVDGFGWDTSVGPNPADWTRIEDQGPCHDPRYAKWWNDMATDGVSDDEHFNWFSMWRYADISTTRYSGWDRSAQTTLGHITWKGEPPAIRDANQYDFVNTVDRRFRTFEAKDDHSYTNILPSLNLNYVFSDAFIGRFAISKTMTRPEIDQTRAGYVVTERAWYGEAEPVNTVNEYNTKLDPLESKNFDMSVEWYFNELSMVSLALFHKDMSNFTETETVESYIVDLRNRYSAVDPVSELYLKPTEDATNENYGLEGCMPIRGVADAFKKTDSARVFSNDLRDICGKYLVSKIVNGESATVTGFELAYSQAYDFLPGYFLSGLGLSANYTYQDSEYEAQQSSIDPDIMLPAYPVADTPEHTYNMTAFWEQDGHQVRLSYRGSSDSLVGFDYMNGQRGRTWNNGSIWNEGRDTVDLSATYQVSDTISLTFQAINLTDESYRQYFTSRTLDVARVQLPNGEVRYEAYEEGNPLDGGATKSRTYREYKVGTTYRLGLRISL